MGLFFIRVIFLIAAVMSISVFSQTAQARTFRGEGSDLLMGVGASANAKAGAVTASTNDIYSVFWNPAGLVETTSNQVTVSGQVDQELTGPNFLGISFSNKLLHFGGFKTAFAFSRMPRLHVKAIGNYRSDDFESIFLRYALPGLPNDFDGEIESKTRDTRLTFAIAPLVDPGWSFGINIGRIKCGSRFCGVFANDPGVYKVASADATAITVGLGAKIFLNNQVTLGLNIKDVHTRLDVITIVTDVNGTTVQQFKTGFPRDIMAGLLWKYSRDLDFTVDYQFTYGKYGTSRIHFQLLRAGLEKRSGSVTYRLGVMVPIELDSDSTGNIKDDLPAPLLPTIGLGWKLGYADIDFSVYPNPIMSYTKRKLYPSADLSIKLSF